MVKKKSAGPRLKLCQECEEPNAPRQFHCKACGHPFYSEEYFASRPAVLPPQTPTSLLSETNEFMRPLGEADRYVVDSEALRTNIYNHLNLASFQEGETKNFPEQNREIEIFFDQATTFFCLNHRDSVCVQDNHHLMFCGDSSASVDSVSILNDVLAVNVGGEKIEFWKISKPAPKFLGEVSGCFPYMSQVKWVSQSSVPGHVSGLLIVVSLDRLDLLLIPEFSEKNDKQNLAFNDALVWSSTSIPEPFFPAKADGRISPTGSEIQLISVNNTSSFSHFFSLSADAKSRNLKLTQLKVYGCNIPARRLGEETSTSTGTGLCVSFVADHRYKFVSGLSTGLLALFDLRDDQGPETVTQAIAGQRRWFREILSLGNDTYVAAFQAGCVITNLKDEGNIQPVGGDVKSAQCVGVGALGTQVFSAMNAGAVMYVDYTLREKIRRGMTKYLGIWGVQIEEEDLENETEKNSLEDHMFSRLTKRQTYGKFMLKLFPDKPIAKNLKYLKASDGASNETELPREFGDVRAARICCLAADETSRVVVYGLEGGLLHITYFS